MELDSVEKAIFNGDFKSIVVDSAEFTPDGTQLQFNFSSGILPETVEQLFLVDMSGHITRTISWDDFLLADEFLLIDIASLPVTGPFEFYVSNGVEVLKVDSTVESYAVEGPTQWKVVMEAKNVQLTPKSNGRTRPKRRQLVIKKYLIDQGVFQTNIGLKRIEAVIAVNEDNQHTIELEWSLTNKKLAISLHGLPNDESARYKILVLSGGVWYRIFSPEEKLLSEFSRYHSILGEVYFYFSSYGYLKAAVLNNDQYQDVFYKNDILLDYAKLGQDFWIFKSDDFRELPEYAKLLVVQNDTKYVIDFERIASDAVKVSTTLIAELLSSPGYPARMGITLENHESDSLRVRPIKIRKLSREIRDGVMVSKPNSKEFSFVGTGHHEVSDINRKDSSLLFLKRLNDGKVEVVAKDSEIKIDFVFLKYAEKNVDHEIEPTVKWLNKSFVIDTDDLNFKIYDHVRVIAHDANHEYFESVIHLSLDNIFK